MPHSSIASINRLSPPEQRAVYQRLIPPEVLEYFGLSPYLVDKNGNDLFDIVSGPNDDSVEISLFHLFGFADPILYGHLTDTLNGQIHVLLYIMNDPASPRYDVDRMPDGSPTRFGTLQRNLTAESQALKAGLSPGQVRAGLHLLKQAQGAFEVFITSLGHTMYFVEPLYYHNAIIFERYGFAYQQGRRRMESIHQGFLENGEYHRQLGQNEFRPVEGANSIRLRSWAIHDGILGQSFSNVTMYKTIGKSAGLQTAPGTNW